jgi:pilus assembly protein CpaE
MSARPSAGQDNTRSEITILLVDDIPETRENIKKLLAFEPDFRVVGTASTGREGVDLTKEFRPDVVLMDINMPDMDGLQATEIIDKQVPTSAVIIMSVQSDQDYYRRAMNAGARDFLTKPINMDELYSTIRSVYKRHEAVRMQYAAIDTSMPVFRPVETERREHAGHVIAVYSPQGGAGVTTIATSIAAGLMKAGAKVLLVDADLQFADVGAFLNLQAQSTIVELVDDVEDLDVEMFENIVTTHESGLKVLLGPSRPELSEEVKARPGSVAAIVDKVRAVYDFVVVDTNTALDEVVLGVFDIANKIVLVGTPTLISIKNLRFVLDVFDQLGYDKEKTSFVLNRVFDDRRGKTSTISPERIESFLKRTVVGRIPSVDERVILNAVNKGVPVVAMDRDQSKPPTKQLLELADHLYSQLMGHDEGDDEGDDAAKISIPKFKGILGR